MTQASLSARPGANFRVAGGVDPRLVLLARVLLASAFIVSGLSKLFDFPGAIAEVRALTGLEPEGLIAALVIATQLGGSALLIAGGRLGMLGAALLAGSTFVATLFGHAFWTQDGIQRMRDLTTFFELMGLIGGFLLASLLSTSARKCQAPARGAGASPKWTRLRDTARA